jgi:hypothetical protein
MNDMTMKKYLNIQARHKKLVGGTKMSYVEKSVYRYLRKIITTGVKALFKRKFLIYTIFFLIVTVTTTLTAILEQSAITLFSIPTEDMLNYLLYFELAFAVAYLFVGFFLAKLPLYIHMPFLVLLGGGFTTGLYFYDNIAFSSILCYVLYCLWIIITLFSAFSFSRNLFGSKISGSLLFLGKKQEKPALFTGIMAPLMVVLIGLNGYIIYKGIILGNYWLYLLVGVIGIVVNIFLLISLWTFSGKDDVFYTILPFFYLVTNTHTVQLAIRLMTNDINYLSWVSLIAMLFFLLNSVSKYYRKVANLDTDFLPENKEERPKHSSSESIPNNNSKAVLDGEFFVTDFLRFLSERGVIMIILGFAMAYHTMILQLGFQRTVVFNVINLTSGIVQTGHSISLLFSAGMVIAALLLFRWSKRFELYASPPIFRLKILPTYDELDEFFTKAKNGEINWGIFARDATIKMAQKGVQATTKLGVSVKKQTIRIAKKGTDNLKEKTKSLVGKAASWTKDLLSKEEEPLESDSFNIEEETEDKE